MVDEAHCIGEWGHDFRPDYLRLGAVIEALGHPVVYISTRKHAEEIAAAFQERGVKTVAYHAGMKTAERERVQEAFMSESFAPGG